MHRREKLFFILASVFMSSLVMANIIGITKFFEFQVPFWGYTVTVPVGVIPYPVTFLATDLISELYGRRRASFVVLVGFWMNVFLITVCAIGRAVPVSEDWSNTVEKAVQAGQEGNELWHLHVYPYVWSKIWIGVYGSMAAYIIAQLVDVHLFHFWKRLTKGKHLWLRNNASTMCSQLIDTTVIVLFVFGPSAARGELSVDSPFSEGKAVGYAALAVFIFNSYLFKVFFAAFDTPFFYVGTRLLKPLVGEPDAGETRYREK